MSQWQKDRDRGRRPNSCSSCGQSHREDLVCNVELFQQLHLNRHSGDSKLAARFWGEPCVNGIVVTFLNQPNREQRGSA